MPLIKVSKRAELELIDACKWYEEQQSGLSLRLRKEIERSINRVGKNPLHYQVRYDQGMRFAVVDTFPFLIVYHYNDQTDTVIIVSIFNTNRKPKHF